VRPKGELKKSRSRPVRDSRVWPKSPGGGLDIPSGTVFDRLTIVGRLDVSRNQKGIWWLCRCDCGKEHIVSTSNLISRQIRSCGCFRKDHPNSLTHGESGTAKNSTEYISWRGMKSRCLNPKDTKYSYYGGRGVVVCERWMEFKNFVEDMGRKPDKSYTLDRIRVNEGYSPNNCKWSTRKEQRNNQRRNTEGEV
jgi:hypothetical protein